MTEMDESPIARAGRLAAARQASTEVAQGPTALGQAGAIVTEYMFLQAGVGMIYGLIGLPFWPAAGLAVGWEAARSLMGSGPRNPVADVAAALAGWWFTSRRRRRKQRNEGR